VDRNFDWGRRRYIIFIIAKMSCRAEPQHHEKESNFNPINFFSVDKYLAIFILNKPSKINIT